MSTKPEYRASAAHRETNAHGPIKKTFILTPPISGTTKPGYMQMQYSGVSPGYGTDTTPPPNTYITLPDNTQRIVAPVKPPVASKLPPSPKGWQVPYYGPTAIPGEQWPHQYTAV